MYTSTICVLRSRSPTISRGGHSRVTNVNIKMIYQRKSTIKDVGGIFSLQLSSRDRERNCISQIGYNFFERERKSDHKRLIKKIKTLGIAIFILSATHRELRDGGKGKG